MSSCAISALERGHRRRPQRETVALLVGALTLDGEQRMEFEAAARSGRTSAGRASVTAGPWPGARTSALPQAGVAPSVTGATTVYFVSLPPPLADPSSAVAAIAIDVQELLNHPILKTLAALLGNKA